MSNPQPWDPEGPLVPTTPALSPSWSILSKSLPSKSINFAPLSESHTKGLYDNIGGPDNAQLYKYLPTGPHNDLESCEAFLKSAIDDPMTVAFTLLKSQKPLLGGDEESDEAIGVISLANFDSKNRTIEMGAIFSPRLQHTIAATEAAYLLLKHSFEDLNYRRVEWKTDSLNEPSKRAALRLGFTFEGVFRKHMIVKGRSRDTAWFSITDEEWPVVRDSLEKWLGESNFDEAGKQLRKLEEIRESLVGKDE